MSNKPPELVELLKRATEYSQHRKRRGRVGRATDAFKAVAKDWRAMPITAGMLVALAGGGGWVVSKVRDTEKEIVSVVREEIATHDRRVDAHRDIRDRCSVNLEAVTAELDRLRAKIEQLQAEIPRRGRGRR